MPISTMVLDAKDEFEENFFIPVAVESFFIENKIISLFKELNFKEEVINNFVVYEFEGKYLKLTFINKLKAYVIEYADSYDEANKNLFEDGDLYPITMDEAELISKMRNEITNS